MDDTKFSSMLAFISLFINTQWDIKSVYLNLGPQEFTFKGLRGVCLNTLIGTITVYRHIVYHTTTAVTLAMGVVSAL